MLRADDPRHGLYAGAVAHWREGSPLCGACKLAATRRRKLNRLRVFQGNPSSVPALGTVRRIRALQALGWSFPQIAEAAGLSARTLHNPTHRGTWVLRTTADAVDKAYEALSMTRPDGPYAERCRAAAARKGWPPPLAWTNIDDPNEQPTDWAYTEPTRAELLAELDDHGANLTEVCRRLGVGREALGKWASRHGMAATFSRLVAREQPDYERFATGRRAS